MGNVVAAGQTVTKVLTTFVKVEVNGVAVVVPVTVQGQGKVKVVAWQFGQYFVF